MMRVTRNSRAGPWPVSATKRVFSLCRSSAVLPLNEKRPVPHGAALFAFWPSRVMSCMADRVCVAEISAWHRAQVSLPA